MGMATERMLTTPEVAERLNVTTRRVLALIQAGRLPSQQYGRDHLVKESDLKLVEDRKPGRPPKALGGATAKAPAETTAKLNRAFREATEAEEASKKATKKRGSKK